MRITSTISHTRGATIVELMVVLAILGLGITALLETIWWGIGYARDTENNIKAINIAREGIEGMTNIRDTNWLRFSSDKTNCWKVKDYTSTCIGNSAATILSPMSYTLISMSGLWFLSW
jgi:type II secretory pathway pseudopilin PulG